MRKTTIFRSSSIALLVVLLLSMVSGAQAQDSLQVSQASGVHVVTDGETLWGIAAQYFGDPFLWPEIYRQNTLVVEDPHWIFPGEELRIGPAPVAQAPVTREPTGVEETPEVIGAQRPPEQPPVEEPTEPEPDVQVEAPEVLPPPVAPPPPSSESAPSVFTPQARARMSGLGASGRSYRYRPIRRFEFYAAGFLTEGERLPWGHVLGAVGRPTLGNLRATSAQRIYGEVEIRPPEGGAYQVGDSLLVVTLKRDVDDWGKVAVPTGIVRVVEAQGDRVIAEVVAQFARVADGQVVLPIEPFADPGDVAPVPVANGLTGNVIEVRDQAPVAGQQDIIFINRGRNDGVALGDVFAILQPSQRQGFAPDTLGYMQVVHVRDRSASAILMVINDLGVGPDSPVQLYRKMP